MKQVLFSTQTCCNGLGAIQIIRLRSKLFKLFWFQSKYALFGFHPKMKECLFGRRHSRVLIRSMVNEVQHIPVFSCCYLVQPILLGLLKNNCRLSKSNLAQCTLAFLPDGAYFYFCSSEFR